MAKRKKRDLVKDLAEYEKKRLQSDLNSGEDSPEKRVAEVEKSLYKKAVGGTVTETTKKISNGRVHSETKIKQVPPDQRAIEYFLNNRAADKWKNNPAAEDNNDNGKIAELMEGLKDDIHK